MTSTAKSISRTLLHCLLCLGAWWSASSRLVCPQDWFLFEDACYGAFEGPKTWDEARASCEEKGSNLTSIHSEVENNHAIFACGNTRPFHGPCWIGGTDRNQRHRKWIWVDGSKWDWDKWFDHGGGNREPNNDFCTNHRHCVYGSTSDCNTLQISAKEPFRGYWLDTFCTDKQKYICQVAAQDFTVDSENSSAEAGNDTSVNGEKADTERSLGEASHPLTPPALKDPPLAEPASHSPSTLNTHLASHTPQPSLSPPHSLGLQTPPSPPLPPRPPAPVPPPLQSPVATPFPPSLSSLEFPLPPSPLHVPFSPPPPRPPPIPLPPSPPSASPPFSPSPSPPPPLVPAPFPPPSPPPSPSPPLSLSPSSPDSDSDLPASSPLPPLVLHPSPPSHPPHALEQDSNLDELFQ
eukprot:TRINITY_DN5177_c0_g2_i1.p1 TRINITY_DN5177_c0_g2~~TRINITY_DN5177_c0_g2_i1.p1  ORF type:complete len:407 (+),score=64.22 TRINITY_DN5177_c0_g2_i1:102-1322(+)